MSSSITPATQPGRVGRPPAVLYHREIEALAALGLTMNQIAARVGVCKRTLQARCEQDPTLREAAERGLARATELYAGILAEKIKAGDTTALIFWLKAKAGWSTVQRSEPEPAAPPAPANEERFTRILTSFDEMRDRQNALLAAAKEREGE